MSAWLMLAARPDLIGKRTSEDKPIAALSDSLRSTAAPHDRKLLLQILGELEPGQGLRAEETSRVMRWRRPRWGGRLGVEPGHCPAPSITSWCRPISRSSPPDR
ncbi:DNA-binding protein [Mycobacteroides abscessus subsp. massiliense]|nr:DNA-binding protein [Mycobacteroides abscessus subsp. massiliense]